LRGLEFTCVGEGQARNVDGSCVLATGEQVLGVYGLDAGNPVIELVALGIATIVYRGLAYVLLKVVRRK